MLILILITIAVLSTVLSYVSIQNDRKKSKHVEEVKKDLEKGRVIYYAQSSGSTNQQKQSE